MDQPATSSSAARRNEDIALDLLKFIAGTAGFGRTSPASTGFTLPTAAKAEDQITHLLELYTRCLHVVEGKSNSTTR